MSEITQPKIVIECLQKRDGGSFVKMADNVTYHFKPDAHDRHISIVENAAHVQRFAAIPEGYQILGVLSETKGAAPSVTIKAEPISISPRQPSADPIAAPAGGQTGPIVAPVEGYAGPADMVPPVKLPTEEPANIAELDEVALAALADDVLRATYKAEVGRAAPPKAKAETMAASIIEARAIKASV